MKFIEILPLFIALLTTVINPLGRFTRRIDATQFLQNPHSFINFCNLLKETQLEHVLANRKLIGSSRTIIAPTDKAFRKFGLLGLIKKKRNSKSLLKDLVNHHIIKKRITPKNIQKNTLYSYKTESGTSIKLKEFVPFILYSVETETAMVHVIDHILIPQSLKKYLK
jgi:uncharacterized surface protein with fasciclin (FAS1) repeats